MLTPEHKAPSAETWLRARYGAYRGHFAWRELEEAYAAGAQDMQERCAKAAEAVTVGQPQLLTVTETHVMDITAIEAGRVIRALETT